MGFTMIAWVIGAVIVIGLVAYLLRRGSFASKLGGPPAELPGRDPAETTLRDRYAKGEISDEEYHQRLDRLHAPGHHA